MRFPSLFFACCVGLTSVGADEAVALPPALATAQRVVILGDSITYGGAYVDFISADGAKTWPFRAGMKRRPP